MPPFLEIVPAVLRGISITGDFFSESIAILNKKHELYLLFSVMLKNRNPVNFLYRNLGNLVFPEI